MASQTFTITTYNPATAAQDAYFSINRRIEKIMQNACDPNNPNFEHDSSTLSDLYNGLYNENFIITDPYAKFKLMSLGLVNHHGKVHLGVRKVVLKFNTMT